MTKVDAAGEKRASEFWFRGQLVGRAHWGPDGPTTAGGLRSGVRHGYQIEYRDGAVSYAEPFSGGLPHSWAKQYNRSGMLLLECPFEHGTGSDFWCNEDGSLAEEHPLVAGKPSGVERWWSDERSIFEETSWLEGQWHGARRLWRGGRLVPGYPRFFIHGRRVSKRVYSAAAPRDPTLPPARKEDDSPLRALPEEFVRLRARARRAASRR